MNEYRLNEVAEKVGVSIHTIQKWFQWERFELRDGKVDKPYLPAGRKLMNLRGKPRVWTDEDVEVFIQFHKNMVVGPKGRYGVYSNPLHKEETNE